MDKAPLQLVLPCKPDRAEREVDMGEGRIPLQMLGCDADGATFALSHAQVADAASAARLLDGWRQAVLKHVAAVDVRASPWSVAGGLQTPQSLRLQAQARRADGSAVTLHAVWFSVADAAGVHLYHGVMLSPRPRPEVADAFFSGMAPAP